MMVDIAGTETVQVNVGTITIGTVDLVKAGTLDDVTVTGGSVVVTAGTIDVNNTGTVIEIERGTLGTLGNIATLHSGTIEVSNPTGTSIEVDHGTVTVSNPTGTNVQVADGSLSNIATLHTGTVEVSNPTGTTVTVDHGSITITNTTGTVVEVADGTLGTLSNIATLHSGTVEVSNPTGTSIEVDHGTVTVGNIASIGNIATLHLGTTVVSSLSDLPGGTVDAVATVDGVGGTTKVLEQNIDGDGYIQNSAHHYGWDNTGSVWQKVQIATATGALKMEVNYDTTTIFDDAEGDPTNVSGTAAADGTSSYASRRDHRHDGVDASTTVKGITELATGAETTTGTDTGRTVTPDGLAASDYGKRVLGILVFDDSEDVATGDGAGDIFVRIPSVMDGWNLVDVEAQVQTAGTTSTTDIQVHNVTDTADMLSTKITIDSGETDSSTAATAPVIDTGNDDVATADSLRIDVDAVSTTAPKGLFVELTFQNP